jgi:flavin reductase (DIM6/NTAB) family NADH-FMN oxidoreductase RutF
MTAIAVPGTTQGIDPDSFRQAFRQHPAGVVVITLNGRAGPVGFTATSLTSLSLRPPLVCFGVAAAGSTWPHLADASTAVVNFLDATQEAVARRFATHGIDRFAGPTRWSTLAGGEPVLDGVAGWLRLGVESRIPTGDHRIVVARVLEADLDAKRPPLVYYNGRYHSIRQPGPDSVAEREGNR